MNRHIGIVVVHGVMPHPRYEIQDLAAESLCDRLDKRHPGGPGQKWAVGVVNPPPPPAVPVSPPTGYIARTTLSRVHLVDAHGEVPGSDRYDVVEAFWSPIDKGKTTWLRVLSWLLSTIFIPANTTARYMASWRKTFFDIVYVLFAGALGVGALLAALKIALDAFQKVASIAGTGSSVPVDSTGLTALWQILSNPASIGTVLSLQAIGLLACAVVGGFLLMQALRAAISVGKQRSQLTLIPVQLWSRVIFVAVLLILAGGLLCAAALAPLPKHVAMGRVALEFAEAAFAFELGRALLESFIAAFFGDVQIYTTRDENSDFFILHAAILDLVTKIIGDMTAAAAADGTHPYDRVHVLAHSLGSTIAMDAIIGLYNLKEQGLYDRADFNRIRSFVTFGSPLEKTKYFFDVGNPSQSLSYVQWRNDAYGVLFTDRRASLQFPNGADEGIFWMNFWYFKDPVANKVDSYRSFLVPGDRLADASSIRDAMQHAAVQGHAGRVAIGRQCCLNEEHPGIINPFVLRFIPHGDYLGDDWFWYGPANFGALAVVMSADSVAPKAPYFTGIAGLAPRPAPPGLLTAPPPPPPAPHVARYELVSARDARWHRDRY